MTPAAVPPDQVARASAMPHHARCSASSALPACITADRRRQHGLSLVELVMFIMVLGLALSAVLGVFSQAVSASADPQIRRQALAIAESLMEEVQLMPWTFCDPDDAHVDTASNAGDCASLSEAPGPESGETRYGSPQFDNVNDYDGFAMNGIQDISNIAVPGLSAYSASVRVAADDLGSLSAASGEAVRITVTVTGPGALSLSLTGYRTRHAPNAGT